MKILSLGAGVQSSTMALMAEHGELETPDCAIFADTGWEPRAVYDWLEKLLKEIKSFPVYKVMHGNIRDDLVAVSKEERADFVPIPFFTWNGGMGRRQCTREYKVSPITKKIRELGGKKNNPVELWIGISLDECRRMKPNRVKWIHNKWPLVKKRLSRHDCLEWLADQGYAEPPKSSCIGCPFHSDLYWHDLKENYPADFADGVEIDRVIRRMPKFDNEQYMHRSLFPLDEVDFRTPEDMGQYSLFGSDCEGMCGV